MYLGQVSKSTDKTMIGIAKDIINGLIFKSKRILEKKIKVKKVEKRLITIKANCHSFPKKNFENEIKITGIV